ncbi:MAG TPA: DUF1189 family protein [Terriglobales bacterium]|nr:DUF1189 family protein [Terriglobales bacterium]
MSSPGPVTPQPPAPQAPSRKRYSVFQALYMAFYSADLYQDVGARWQGVGAAYLLLVVVLSWLPVLIKMQVTFSDFATHDAPKIIGQIPPITIDKGKVSTTVDTPYFIKDPDTGKELAILDTSGQITSLDGHPSAFLLLTQSRLISRQSNMEVREYDLSQVQHFEFNREKALDWLLTFKNLLLVMVAPFAILFGYIYRILQLLLYAAIGMGFASMIKLKVEYGVMMRLAAVAVTPALLINMAFDLWGKSIPFWWLICFAIAMCYLFFAVKSAAANKA